MKTTILSVALLSALCAFAERQSFDRYQTVVDRQMFGPLPENFDPTKSPDEVKKLSSKSKQELTKEQEKLKSAIHFSVVNRTADGQTEVGFTDNSNPKAPKYYFIRAGETRDGWTVEEADADTSTMTIVKDEIRLELTLGDNSAKGGGTVSRADETKPSKPKQSLLGGSLRERLKRMREEERAAEREERAAEREAQRAQIEALQKKAEEDEAQRVAEREATRAQLMFMQSEIKKAREAKEADSDAGGDGNKKEGDDASDDAS